MKIIIADHNKSTIASINECNPSFELDKFHLRINLFNTADKAQLHYQTFLPSK